MSVKSDQAQLTLTGQADWTVTLAGEVLDIAERFREDPRIHEKALAVVLSASSGNDALPPLLGGGKSAEPPLELPEHLGGRLRTMLDALPTDTDGAIAIRRFQPQTFLEDLRMQFGDQQQLTADAADAVRVGHIPMGMLGLAAGRPAALAYVQRATGLIPVATNAPEDLAADFRAARSALGKRVAVDVSALAVATLLPAGRIDELRAQFADALVPVFVIDDIAATRHAVNQLSRSSAQFGFERGMPHLSELTDEQKRYLLARGDALAGAVVAFQPRDVPTVQPMRQELGFGRAHLEEEARESALDAAWLGAAQLAKELGIPLWCDDATLRNMVRDCGVETFGSLALMRVLTQSSLARDFTETRFDEDIRTLLSEYVVDLPLSYDMVRDQAERDNWEPRSAAAVFARPSRWAEVGTEQAWVGLLTHVWDQKPDHLPQWFPTAAYGVAGSDAPADVAAKLAALLSLVLVRVTGVGAEPLQVLWPTAIDTLMGLHDTAVRRQRQAFSEDGRIDDVEAHSVIADRKMAAQVMLSQCRVAMVTFLTGGENPLGLRFAEQIVDAAIADAGLA